MKCGYTSCGRDASKNNCVSLDKKPHLYYCDDCFLDLKVHLRQNGLEVS